MNRSLGCAVVFFSLLLAGMTADSPTSDNWIGTGYEFASVHWAGDKTSIIWPDGTVLKVIAFGGKRRPEAVAERMWYLTGAMNIMGKRGFELVHIGNEEVVMKRVTAK